MVGIPAYVLIFVVSFLLGSIPFGLIICKVFYHKDIREVGSGNIGTTNAIRATGKGGGAMVFLLDFGKGILSGFLSTVIPLLFVATSASIGAYEQTLCCAVAFLGVILGHVFSPWLGFHGGKGVAAAAGVLPFLFGPVGFLIELAGFILAVVITRRVSVGSLTAAIMVPFLAVHFCWGNPLAWALALVGAGIVVFAHRANIQRLRDGVEPRIGEKA